VTKKILFISHDAQPTGAPIFLLNFLRWFSANTGIPFTILLREGGALEPDFAALTAVSVCKNKTRGKRTLIGGAIQGLDLLTIIERVQLRAIKKRLARDKIGLIYSNTITNGLVLEALSSLGCPVISHVHELEYVIRHHSGGPKNLERVRQHTEHYIAVSQAVKDNLIQNHGILESTIEVIYGFVSSAPDLLGNREGGKSTIRELLNIPENALIVGASGMIQWQKGTDLFIQLAQKISQQETEFPVHFLWVGGETEGANIDSPQDDIKNLGLEDRIHFVGFKPNPVDYFSVFDVFVLVSREDSFPLVMLETAALGKPIVCFADAGGAEEFVEDDCGFVVPYLDIEAMAEKVLELLNSTSLRRRFGQQAAQKVRERHDITVIAPRIAEVIERFL
jgi:glycosyltransferase involved in cell wall biosynthesis